MVGMANSIGKYQLGRAIGEGTFAKVKLALNSKNREYVAIKIIDKQMVVKENLVDQVQREIQTMKILHHPNIVRIHEVIGTKTKIYIVMDYVSGGQVSDRLSYKKRLSESEARRLFQQLIDAMVYCHNRGVYHRDLKPENLLLDLKGNLKVSDFGLSTLRKPGDMLTTACGSPSYVAPELLMRKDYDGAAADVWSCGVILFELLTGNLPFDSRNLMNLYKKICRADYKCPEWMTPSQNKLISQILDPNPATRITLHEIIENEWFQENYKPSCGIECNENVSLDDVHAAFDSLEESTKKNPSSPSFINAFQLIAMSHDLDLSGFFKDQDDDKQRITFGSKNSFTETMQKIEAAAKDVSLSVERMNSYKMKIHPKQKIHRCSSLSAEVIEVAPAHCVIEISKSAGELGMYTKFCRSLSSLLYGTSIEEEPTTQSCKSLPSLLYGTPIEEEPTTQSCKSLSSLLYGTPIEEEPTTQSCKSLSSLLHGTPIEEEPTTRFCKSLPSLLYGTPMEEEPTTRFCKSLSSLLNGTSIEEEPTTQSCKSLSSLLNGTPIEEEPTTQSCKSLSSLLNGMSIEEEPTTQSCESLSSLLNGMPIEEEPTTQSCKSLSSLLNGMSIEEEPTTQSCESLSSLLNGTSIEEEPTTQSCKSLSSLLTEELNGTSIEEEPTTDCINIPDNEEIDSS